jgi:hypothetical protein
MPFPLPPPTPVAATANKKPATWQRNRFNCPVKITTCNFEHCAACSPGPESQLMARRNSGYYGRHKRLKCLVLEKGARENSQVPRVTRLLLRMTVPRRMKNLPTPWNMKTTMKTFPDLFKPALLQKTVAIVKVILISSNRTSTLLPAVQQQQQQLLRDKHGPVAATASAAALATRRRRNQCTRTMSCETCVIRCFV